MNLEKQLLEAIAEGISNHPLSPREQSHHRRIMHKCLNSKDRIGSLSKHLSWVSGVPLRESDVIPATDCEVFEGIQLTESAFNEELGLLDITILKPGLNMAGTRYYPDKTLKESAARFAGVKMYADHDTTTGKRERPERSIRDFVGVVKETYIGEDGSIRGKAQIIESWLKEKISNLQKNGLLHTLGVSHSSLGRFTLQKVQGKTVQFVESITLPRSVDFVTEPGAGGLINFMESKGSETAEAESTKINNSGGLNMDEDDLKAMKESLANLTAGMVEVTGRLDSVKSENDTLKTENEALKAKLQESERESFKAHAEAKISESDLPEKSKERILSLFSESTDLAAFDEAVKAEVEYVKTIKESLGKPVTRVHNVGPKVNGTQDIKVDTLAESFNRYLGIPKEMAESMAEVRR